MSIPISSSQSCAYLFCYIDKQIWNRTLSETLIYKISFVISDFFTKIKLDIIEYNCETCLELKQDVSDILLKSELINRHVFS